MTQADVAKRTADFRGMCRRQGIKATHQRIAIFLELAGTREHPNAETVYKDVRKHMPTISFDTVYRTLRTFEGRGIIARMGSAGDCMRFDADTGMHPHFVCRNCGLMVDLDAAALRHLSPAVISMPGRVDSIHVEFRGLCRKCRRKERSPR